MRWFLLFALWLALPAWAEPFATAQIAELRATHCDYEDTTIGEAAHVPVVVDLVRGEVANGHRVCKFDISHWAPGSVHEVRMRSYADGFEPSEWTSGTLDRPALASVVMAIVPGEIEGGGDVALTLADILSVASFNLPTGTSWSGETITVPSGCGAIVVLWGERYNSPSAETTASFTINSGSPNAAYSSASAADFGTVGAAIFSGLSAGSYSIAATLTGASTNTAGAAVVLFLSTNAASSAFVDADSNGNAGQAPGSLGVTLTGLQAGQIVFQLDDHWDEAGAYPDPPPAPSGWTSQAFGYEGLNYRAWRVSAIVTSGTSQAVDSQLLHGYPHVLGVAVGQAAGGGGSVKRWPPQMQGGMRSLTGGMQ